MVGVVIFWKGVLAGLIYNLEGWCTKVNAIGAILDGERDTNTVDKVQVEGWWWICEGDRWSEEVERVILECLSITALVTVMVEEEVLLGCGNIMI